MNWWQRLFGSERLERELDKELRFHFEQQVADNIRTGMTEEQARRATRLAFGGLNQVKKIAAKVVARCGSPPSLRTSALLCAPCAAIAHSPWWRS